jgi:clan AA aspartic protease
MIRGTVTEHLEATIPIALRAADGQTVSTIAVIDTGFNGHLALPPEMIARLGFEPIGHLSALLGDGRRALLAVYEATVVWGGEDRAVEALRSEARALVGMSLLRGSNVTITVQVGGSVLVEQGD